MSNHQNHPPLYAHYVTAIARDGDQETVIMLTTASEDQYEETGNPGDIIAAVLQESHDKASRLADCFNACAGVPSDQLRPGVLAKAIEQQELINQTLGRFKDLINWAKANGADPAFIASMSEQARLFDAATPDWTDADQEAAAQEGWGIFNTGNASKPVYQVQRIDAPESGGEPKFESDEDAWLALTQEDSAVKRKALVYMQAHNPQESQAMIRLSVDNRMNAALSFARQR